MIEADQVQVRAGGRLLLDGVSVQVRPGRVLAVLGPNGAGKSTLVDVLAGGRVPQSGRVSVGGRPMAGWTAGQLARVRAVLPQSTTLPFAFTVGEVVALGRQPFAGTPAMRDDAAAIAASREALDLGSLWQREFPGLSGGEQQRVHMARVLAQLWRGAADQAMPRSLLLDEPTAALDLRHRRSVLSLARGLAGAGLAVLAVLHDLNLAAAYADDVLLLREGRVLVHGPAAAVLRGPALQACFDVDIEVLTRGDGTPVFVT